MGAIRFGVDGWRAAYGDGFDETGVARLAEAAARLFAQIDPQGTVYVGYDTRRDARHYAELAASVIAGCGLDAVLSDAHCPTPALGWSVAQDVRAVGGLMVTGGYDPYGTCGVKVRMADGGAAPRDFTDALELALPPSPTDRLGDWRPSDLMTPYLDALKGMVDAEAICAARLKVVVDPLFGSARGHLARVLRDLGVEVAEVNNAPIGEELERSGMRPEPIAPWTDTCRDVVVASEPHAGFSCDGDGSRVGILDGRGRLMSAHVAIALALEALVRGGAAGRVVVTAPSSTLVRRQAARLGCELTEVPIGYKWVYGEMLKGDVLLGAEEPGGMGVPAHLPERDGLAIALLLCQLMAQTGKSLDRLVDSLADQIGCMEYGRRDLRLDGATLQMFQNMLPGLNPASVAGMKPVEVSHKDGLRVGFADDSWLLIRPSGTEPLVRVYAEAPTAAMRDALLDAACELVGE